MLSTAGHSTAKRFKGQTVTQQPHTGSPNTRSVAQSQQGLNHQLMHQGEPHSQSMETQSAPKGFACRMANRCPPGLTEAGSLPAGRNRTGHVTASHNASSVPSSYTFHVFCKLGWTPTTQRSLGTAAARKAALESTNHHHSDPGSTPLAFRCTNKRTVETKGVHIPCTPAEADHAHGDDALLVQVLVDVVKDAGNLRPILGFQPLMALDITPSIIWLPRHAPRRVTPPRKKQQSTLASSLNLPGAAKPPCSSNCVPSKMSGKMTR
jgi:hypothetical protein